MAEREISYSRVVTSRLSTEKRLGKRSITLELQGIYLIPRTKVTFNVIKEHTHFILCRP